MNHASKNCIHPPGSGHQKKIWEKALELKNEKIKKEDIKRMLLDEWDGYHEDVSPAVNRAVERVFSLKLKTDKGKKPWPKADKKEIEAVAEKNPYSLQELRKGSPYPASELSKIQDWGLLQLLFPKGSLLCLGESVESCSTKKLEEFFYSDENLPFIVPRTMSGEFGLSQDGKVSTRCNDNTGPERYVVIEFDDMEENVQISMIKHLSQFLPLVLVLHSGGKSFHAWFNGCDASKDRVLAFRRHAASCGADKAVFTRCQMVRMPNQRREENGKFQELHYFDSSKLPNASDGAPSINFDMYPFCTERRLEEPNGIKVPKIMSWLEFEQNCEPEPPEIIKGFLHQGDKCVVGGQSKIGKSHLVQQLCTSVSEGGEFLGMETIKSNVLYLNLELQPFAVKKRTEAMLNKLEINMGNFSLFVANGRGNWSGIRSLDAMVDNIIDLGIELMVIDPLYKVEDMDENDQVKIKNVLRIFDQVTLDTKASFLYVHHFAKGQISDKNSIDLLSGSGVLARDFDSALFLCEDKNGNPSAKFILRNYPPKEEIPLIDDYPVKRVDTSKVGSEGGKIVLNTPSRGRSAKYRTVDITNVMKNCGSISFGELQKKVEERSGMKKSTFSKLLSECLDNGLIESQGAGRRKNYNLPS